MTQSTESSPKRKFMVGSTTVFDHEDKEVHTGDLWKLSSRVASTDKKERKRLGNWRKRNFQLRETPGEETSDAVLAYTSEKLDGGLHVSVALKHGQFFATKGREIAVKYTKEEGRKLLIDNETYGVVTGTRAGRLVTTNPRRSRTLPEKLYCIDFHCDVSKLQGEDDFSAVLNTDEFGRWDAFVKNGGLVTFACESEAEMERWLRKLNMFAKQEDIDAYLADAANLNKEEESEEEEEEEEVEEEKAVSSKKKSSGRKSQRKSQMKWVQVTNSKETKEYFCPNLK